MYRIKTDDNITIAVEDINPQCPDTIMMVHGWPMERTIFEYQAAFFARSGFRCLLVDFRGYGGSGTHACEYSYDRLARDLYRVIRQLRPRNLTLLGYDMGGAVCVRYIAKCGGYGVCRLALAAAAVPSFVTRQDCEYGMDCTELTRMLALAQVDRARMVDEYVPRLYYNTPSAATLRRAKGVCLNNSLIATLESGNALMQESLRRDMFKINIPTAIFHGENDTILPINIAYIQKDCIEDSRLYEFAETGHLIIHEQAEGFNNTLLAFIKDS